ncbi:MAG TPA: hypothetical protein VMI35_06345 [Puia sp.]|nr:hypothetical protein [Puia sp.]
MDKTLKALNEINWKQIEKNATSAGKKVDLEKLQANINQSLRQLDWEKLNRDVQITLSDADALRLSRDIKLQVETLRRLEQKNIQQAARLQQRIREDQLRLEKMRLKKQMDVIHMQEEMIRKKYKIVYI